ncbi:MAG TPA: ATP-grasp domain-containing protein [Vicinamibacteria bacterium]|nr:ATP-grasp domain-containing protein [Vicinamibacteria bacterium]
MSGQRVLLLLPTSTYRTRDFLDAAQSLGIEVVVGSEQTSTLESFQPKRLLTLDFLELEGAAARAREFHARHPLDAVVPVDEETGVAAAAIAAALGLPHNSPEAAVRARLKHRMREALAAGGVAHPSFTSGLIGDDPRLLARGLTYPLVLKPVFLSGSRGVVRVDDQESFVQRFDWLSAFLATPEVREHGGEESDVVLIEEYVDGREVALEGLLTEGRLRPLALFDKPDPLVGPFFEETVYVTPSRLPETTQKEIVRVSADAARAIGLRHGPVHAELRLRTLNRDETPVVIEIAGRSIGGLCSRTLRFGLGISLEELILRHAVGRNVEDLSLATGAAGVMMIPIPKGGKLEATRGLDQARAVSGIEEITITAHLGKTLVPLPEGSSYLGFIFARAEDPESAERALREAHARLSFEIT